MKAIRHQLDVYNTMLRFAYDDRSWKALVNDYAQPPPSNMDPSDPPSSHSGMTFSNTWEPKPGKRRGNQTVLHVGIYVNLAKLENDQAQLVSTVTHECLHAALAIYENVSCVQPPGELGEPFCYLVDWLVCWVWDNLP